ncbi:MAG TPA: hypothetical protein VJV78_47640 [Polyangiales bacterium]|nr:hypothetical protein [Polyangiales bacterium]
MTWPLVRTFATCLLLTAAACYEQESATPSDAGTRRMRDARPDEDPQDSDSAVPDASDAVPDASDTDAAPDAAQPGNADAAPGDAGEPEIPEEDFSDWPEIPDEPMQPPVELPTPSAGACAFEPRPNPPLTVANRKCPDGVVHGSLTLTKASEINALYGCVRVEGNMRVRLEGPSDLNGLQALHVIEGDLVFEGKYFDEGGFHGGNAELTSLKGLENLRCVGGDLRIEQVDRKYSQALDLSALRDLVEVGGSLDIIIRHPDAKIDTFASLQRVWGDAAANTSFTPPRLQSVYGAWSRVPMDATPPNDVYVGCSPNQQPCRDGVLGCAYKANSSAKLAALAKCELALRDLELTAEDGTGLAPLSKLQTVRGRLNIGSEQTPGLLQHLTGLESLKHVGGWLWIRNQPNLRDLHGLSALISAKWIVLEWLGQITDLSGLEHVETAPEELRLSHNDELKTLTGLNFTGSLKNIEIADNAMLTSIAALTSVSGRIETLSLVRLPALESLEGLSNAVGIGGLFIGECGSLTELTALAPSVTEIGRLSVYGCPKLTSLSGLEHLQKAGELSVADCDGLLNLTGLGSLREVSGPLSLSSNDTLQSLDGVPELRKAGSVVLEANPKLAHIDALALVEQTYLRLVDLPALASLEALTNVGINPLWIEKLPALSSLSGLEHTRAELYELALRDNASLTDISVLSQVRDVYWITLSGNAALTTLHGLEGLTTVGGGGILIRNNAALSQVRALSSLTTYTGGLNIQGNLALPQCEIDWLAARLPFGLASDNNGPPGTCSP